MKNTVSLKEILLSYISNNKYLHRSELTSLVKKWGYEKSNAERRMRELCEVFPIKRYDANEREVKNSRWISYWKLTKEIKRSTIFNNK